MSPTRTVTGRAPISFAGLLILGAVPLIVVPLILFLGGGSLKALAPIAGVGFVVVGFMVPPQFLVLSTLVAFLAANMPILNVGGVMNQFRWLILIGMVFGLLFRSAVQDTRSRWHVIHLSLGFFLVYGAVSSTYSVNGLLTILKIMVFAFLVMGAILFGRLESSSEFGGRYSIIELLYWSGVLVAIGCVLGMLKLLPQGLHFFQGPFGNPNALGSYISLAVPILLLKALRSSDKGPVWRVINFALPIAFLGFLLMSRSRAGIVATFLACAFWLFLSPYRKFIVLLIGGALFIVILLATFIPTYVQSLDEVYVMKGHGYILESREKLLQQSWDAAQESPMVGTGFGASKGWDENWEFAFETGNSREKMNSYLALVEEVGVVGGSFLVLPLIWVLIIAVLRIQVVTRIYPSSEEYWGTLTLTACVVGGLCNVFFEAWLTAPGYFSSVMFWMIVGVLAGRLTTPLMVQR